MNAPQISREHVNNDAINERYSERCESLEDARKYKILVSANDVVKSNGNSTRNNEWYNCNSNNISSSKIENVFELRFISDVKYGIS